MNFIFLLEMKIEIEQRPETTSLRVMWIDFVKVSPV